MHDGSLVKLHKVAPDYDPTNREKAHAYLQERQSKGEVPTGLLFVDEKSPDMP